MGNTPLLPSHATQDVRETSRVFIQRQVSFQVKILPWVPFALTGPTHGREHKTSESLTGSFLRFGESTSSETLLAKQLQGLGGGLL